MRPIARALLCLAWAPLACGLDPGGTYNGGDTGGGGLLPSGSLTPSDGGDDGGALSSGSSGEGGALGGLGQSGQGRVRGDDLEGCDPFTYACPTGRKCALYGAIDPAYSNVACGPADLCSIVTCPPLKRCIVGTASPPSLSCQ